MGLDMYLKSIPRVEGLFFEDLVRIDLCLDEEDSITKEELEMVKPYIREEKPIPNYSYKTISNEVGYWRKANHIHNWFVKEVQCGVDNCENYLVSRDDLLKLRDACDQVLSGAPPEEVLPTEDGFFFGSTEYDDYYYEQTKETVDIIDKALELENVYLYYRSSW